MKNSGCIIKVKGKGKGVLVTGPVWPRGFQEV